MHIEKLKSLFAVFVCQDSTSMYAIFSECKHLFHFQLIQCLQEQNQLFIQQQHTHPHTISNRSNRILETFISDYIFKYLY